LTLAMIQRSVARSKSIVQDARSTVRRWGSYPPHISQLTSANRRGLRAIDADIALVEGEVLAGEAVEGAREGS
jgi:hypothetical protein